MIVTLDGSADGRYKGVCECKFTWQGVAEQWPDGTYSPALPIAEASVHYRMCHANTWLDIKFSYQFHCWLEVVWTRADRNNGLGAATRLTTRSHQA